MIKLSPEDVATFEALNVRSKAQTATMIQFMQTFNAMQEDLTRDSQRLWAGLRERYHLEGDWRFEDGKLIAVVPQPPADVPSRSRDETQSEMQLVDDVDPAHRPTPQDRRQADISDLPPVSDPDGHLRA